MSDDARNVVNTGADGEVPADAVTIIGNDGQAVNFGSLPNGDPIPGKDPNDARNWYPQGDDGWVPAHGITVIGADGQPVDFSNLGGGSDDGVTQQQVDDSISAAIAPLATDQDLADAINSVKFKECIIILSKDQAVVSGSKIQNLEFAYNSDPDFFQIIDSTSGVKDRLFIAQPGLLLATTCSISTTGSSSGININGMIGSTVFVSHSVGFEHIIRNLTNFEFSHLGTNRTIRGLRDSSGSIQFGPISSLKFRFIPLP